MDLKIPAMLVALCVFVSSTAFAAPEARDPDGYTWKGSTATSLPAYRGAFFDEDDVTLLEKLGPEAQDKWIEEVYGQEKSMSPAQRKKIYDAKRRAYNKLTPEQQAALLARVEKLRASIMARKQGERDAKLAAAKLRMAETERTYYASLETSERKVLLRYKELLKQGMEQKAALAEVIKEASAGSPSITRQGGGSKKPY
jgi:hypothetical protein